MAKQKILAVDDERHILELISYNLAEAGYEVETVETGEEALSKTAEFHPDLILLDVMLPDIDGLQVCTRLKRDRIPLAFPSSCSRPGAMRSIRCWGWKWALTIMWSSPLVCGSW